ncbi:MAG: hypothetical protein V1843_04450, partial [bacterium]
MKLKLILTVLIIYAAWAYGVYAQPRIVHQPPSSILLNKTFHVEVFADSPNIVNLVNLFIRNIGAKKAHKIPMKLKEGKIWQADVAADIITEPTVVYAFYAKDKKKKSSRFPKGGLVKVEVVKDKIEPEINMLSPRNGETVEEIPLITISLYDDNGLASKYTKLYLDGVPVSNEVTTSNTMMTYLPTILNTGDHALDIQAVDFYGNTAQNKYSFVYKPRRLPFRGNVELYGQSLGSNRSLLWDPYEYYARID